MMIFWSEGWTATARTWPTTFGLNVVSGVPSALKRARLGLGEPPKLEKRPAIRILPSACFAKPLTWPLTLEGKVVRMEPSELSQTP